MIPFDVFGFVVVAVTLYVRSTASGGVVVLSASAIVPDDPGHSAEVNEVEINGNGGDPCQIQQLLARFSAE